MRLSTKGKLQRWKKVVGGILVFIAMWIFMPFWFFPSDVEFYFLPLLPLIGVWALVMPFGLAAVALVVGMRLLGLPLNGKGVKRAMKKVKIKKMSKKKK